MMSAHDSIVAALTGAAGWGDTGRPEQLAAQHRAEILAEVADRLGRRATLYGDSQTVIEVITDLHRLAEAGDSGDGVTVLEIPTHSVPDFFQVGHTYSDPDAKYDWKFRVDMITTHPEDGERTALGWRFFKGVWDVAAYGEDDWDLNLAVGLTDEGDGQ